MSGIAIRSINQQAEQSSDEEGGAEQQQQVRVSQRVNKGVPPHRFIEEINVVSIRVAESKTEVIASEGQMDQSHRQRDGFADEEWDLRTVRTAKRSKASRMQVNIQVKNKCGWEH